MTPATKKATATNPTRRNRTPEEIVADLEAKIAKVKQRAAAKEAKQRPEAQPLIAAVKTVDKALDAARAAGNESLVSSLENASATLAASLIEMGLRVPQRRQVRSKRGQAA